VHIDEAQSSESYRNATMNHNVGPNHSDVGLPNAVLQAWFEQLGAAVITPIRPGMSGARLFRCDTPAGDCMALKCWSSETDLNRVEAIHRVMMSAIENGCSLVPELVFPRHDFGSASFMACQGHCWDLVRWLPGDPLMIDAPLESIQRGASAIARFHASTFELGHQRQVAPAVTERLSRLAQLKERIGSLIDAANKNELDSGLAVAVHRAAQLLRFKWNEVLPQMTQSLSAYLQKSVMTQFVLRDVHREHVLFSGSRPSGLIDFDAVRVDTSAVDLARWAGSFQIFQRDPQAVWGAVLAGVQSESPSREGYFTARDVALANAIATANPWISLANWLQWLLIDKRVFPAGPNAVADRISALTNTAAQGV
jgi:Ser/Thr protein kinase RdoA (MazF antagonist)